jgi:hypothetical protein
MARWMGSARIVRSPGRVRQFRWVEKTQRQKAQRRVRRADGGRLLRGNGGKRQPRMAENTGRAAPHRRDGLPI